MNNKDKIWSFSVCLFEEKKKGISEIAQWAVGEEVVAGSQAAPDGKYDMNAAREKGKKHVMHC